MSLPSALEVLKTRVGDCNEHTTLYVAMARSLGIPARIAVGLVYLRSGGEQIAEDGEEVTYRFLDFRGRGAYPGSAVGLLGEEITHRPPDRPSQRVVSTVPMICRLTVIGPRVRSPPINATP